MKKIVLFAATAIACSTLTSCGVGTAATGQQTTQQAGMGNGEVLGAVLGNTLGATNSGDMLSNIISTFASGIMTNQATIVGTWNYQKPCVQFESESLLAKAGGSMVAANMEQKLDAIYQKAGIKQGVCKFVFNKDNSCQYTIGTKTMTGTYSFNATNKTLAITTQLGHQVTAYVSVTGNAMGLTFDASKLLTLVQGASGVAGLSTIGALVGSFNGMKLGFEFSR